MAHKKLETEGKEMQNVSQQTFYSPIWPKSTPVRLDDNAEEICKKRPNRLACFRNPIVPSY
jgi:hypothetical protein